MGNEAYFTRDGDQFIPGVFCRGPWDPKSLNGRAIVGLLGGVIELRHGSPEFLPARLTVDMYRLPGFAPITVETKVIRDGNRLKLVQAEFISDGKSMALASVQFLRTSQNSPGNVWSPEPWDVAPPADFDGSGSPRINDTIVWDRRPIAVPMGECGRRRVWTRDVRPLFDGIPLTPFQRCALAADFASPCSNNGDKGLEYINSDVTMYLHRLPAGEFIGFDTVNHQASDGVAHGQVILSDETGPIGSASVAALAQKLPSQTAPPAPAPAA